MSIAILSIYVQDDPVQPTATVAEITIDGATVPFTDTVVVREESTVKVTVTGHESTGESVVVNGFSSTGAGEFIQSGTRTEWTFTPSLFDADVFSFLGQLLRDQPLDPTQLNFYAQSPGSLSQPLTVNIEFENIPSPPILWVTASIGDTQISSPQNTMVFSDGDTLHVEAESIDSDGDIMLINFSGLGGGQTNIIQTTMGHNRTSYDTVLPTGLPFGATLELLVTAADADQRQTTHAIELQVRKPFERLVFGSAFHTTIQSATGGIRIVDVTDRLEVMETDIVTMTVTGADDDPGETFQLLANGPLMASPEIQFATMEGQSRRIGYQLPLRAAGIGTIDADVEIIPGTAAAPTGGRKTYNLDLTLTASGDSAVRTLSIDVVDVDTRGWVFFTPTFQALLTDANDAMHFESVIDEISLDENESLLLAVQGNSIFPSEPLIVHGTGSWLGSPSILESKWGNQSIKTGHSLPFETSGRNALSQSVSLTPGFQAVPIEEQERTYNLELAVSNLFATATRTIVARIQNVNRADDLHVNAYIRPATGGSRKWRWAAGWKFLKPIPSRLESPVETIAPRNRLN